MFIVTTNNVIDIICSKYVFEENGSITLDNGNFIIISENNLEFIDVGDIPDYVEPHKYCYTDEKGFYINPDYVEPTPEPTLNSLQEQISELVSNLDYLTMMTNIELPNESDGSDDSADSSDSSEEL